MSRSERKGWSLTTWLDNYQAHGMVNAKYSKTPPTRRTRLALWLVMLTPTARRVAREDANG